MFSERICKTHGTNKYFCRICRGAPSRSHGRICDRRFVTANDVLVDTGASENLILIENHIVQKALILNAYKNGARAFGICI